MNNNSNKKKGKFLSSKLDYRLVEVGRQGSLTSSLFSTRS